ncbi:MAG: acyl carrier protein [Actinomycetia bacterium]|nr:acyl carrier protein [Actinomycetes bacterium]
MSNIASTTAVSSVMDLIRDNLNISVDDPDLDLVDAGLLDSLGVVILITTLEEKLLYTFPLDDLELDSFRSVRRLAAYLDAAGALARPVW